MSELKTQQLLLVNLLNGPALSGEQRLAQAKGLLAGVVSSDDLIQIAARARSDESGDSQPQAAQ